MSINRVTFVFLMLLCPVVYGQGSKVIEIREAGSYDKDEQRFPGASILSRNERYRVYLYHEGLDIWSDRVVFYKKDNFFRAYGNVVMKQGDSVKMNSGYVEYNGNTKKAKAHTRVLLRDAKNSTLETDTLYLDRNIRQVFYDTEGIVKDSTNTLTSDRGRYFMENKKYRFTSNVNVTGTDFVLNSTQLDYYTTNGHAYMYGPSTIVGEDYDIYCERGFYDTEEEKGYFVKNSTINYDLRTIEGDSLYFNKLQEFATATNNIKLTDTINQTWIYGHYGEVYKAKDSAFVTKRAEAVYLIEKDSMHIHGDVLQVTGKPEERVITGFYGVKFFKNDLRGKCDSIHVNQQTGLTQLLKLPLSDQQENSMSDKQKTLINPVLWSGESQMTGDVIHLISNKETEQLDSLKILDNAFVVEKDTLSEDGFNQVKGRFLYGRFENDQLKTVDVVKNTEMIYYIYTDDTNELVGIKKTICSKMTLLLEDNAIDEITYYNLPDGDISPEKDLPKNARTLRGFAWREDERPLTKEDIFDEEDNNIVLPKIRGLDNPLDVNVLREPEDMPITTEEVMQKKGDRVRKPSVTKTLVKKGG